MLQEKAAPKSGLIVCFPSRLRFSVGLQVIAKQLPLQEQSRLSLTAMAQMGNKADRVATPLLGMAKIFACAQSNKECILRIAGRAVDAVVIAIIGRCLEAEESNNLSHIELLTQAGKVYKARHARVLKDRLHRTPL